MQKALSYMLFLLAALAGLLCLLMLAASIRWFVIDWRNPGMANNLQWALLWGASISGFVAFSAVYIERWARPRN